MVTALFMAGIIPEWRRRAYSRRIHEVPEVWKLEPTEPVQYLYPQSFKKTW